MKKYMKFLIGICFVILLFLVGRGVAFYEQNRGNEITGSTEDKVDILKPETIENEIVSEEDSNMEVTDSEEDPAMIQEAQMFYYEEISKEIKDRINGKSYADNCSVPYDELRYVKVLYWGFDNKTHIGELIVNKAIVEDILEIFEELYELKYPIEKMVLVDEYNADDNASMADNNSSAFNYRVIDGTSKISVHSYGLAIDINPKYNPYVREMDGKTIITPENGTEYADRSLDCQYYITKGDVCYEAFIKRGFTWGGEWQNSKDYQHFQKKLD